MPSCGSASTPRWPGTTSPGTGYAATPATISTNAPTNLPARRLPRCVPARVRRDRREGLALSGGRAARFVLQAVRDLRACETCDRELAERFHRRLALLCEPLRRNHCPPELGHNLLQPRCKVHGRTYAGEIKPSDGAD